MFKNSNRCSAIYIFLSLFFWTSAFASEKSIEFFGTKTWQDLQRQLPHPAAIIFTTTDCSHCPTAIKALADKAKDRTTKPPLIVVVMDGENQRDWIQESHYAAADRIFVFKGNVSQLQRGVNAKWHGVTPYIALLQADGGTNFVLGKPSSSVLDQWLDRHHDHE